MPPIIPDPEDDLPPPNADGVQMTLGELEENARAVSRRSPRDDEAEVRHTGQIARDVYRD